MSVCGLKILVYKALSDPQVVAQQAENVALKKRLQEAAEAAEARQVFSLLALPVQKYKCGGAAGIQFTGFTGTKVQIRRPRQVLSLLALLVQKYKYVGRGRYSFYWLYLCKSTNTEAAEVQLEEAEHKLDVCWRMLTYAGAARRGGAQA